MKVATISLNIAWQDIEKNLERAEKFVLQAKADGCDVVVLPEVFNTGFICLLYTSPSPRDQRGSRMPSSA